MTRTSFFLMLLLVFNGLFYLSCKSGVSDDGTGTGYIGQSPDEWELTLASSGKHKLKKRSGNPIPAENMLETSEPPVPDVDTDDAARKLVDAFAKNKTSFDFFIPYNCFSKLTGINLGNKARESEFVKNKYKNLRKKYERKLQRYLKKDFAGAIFESVALGSCKWIKPGENFNKLGFWKCKNNKIYYHHNGERKNLRVKQMINWGKRWYIYVF